MYLALSWVRAAGRVAEPWAAEYHHLDLHHMVAMVLVGHEL
jgi:hypothetical protein